MCWLVVMVVVGWFCSVLQEYKTRSNPHKYNPLVNITNVFNKTQRIINYFQYFAAIISQKPANTCILFL